MSGIPRKEIKMKILPDKALYRVREVADYFSVTVRTVYEWIEHGLLDIEETPAGRKRVTRESLTRCRLRKKREIE